MQSTACWILVFLGGGICSEMVLSSGNFHMSFEPPGALRALIIARKPHLSRFHFRVTGFTPRLWSLATSSRWSTKSKALRSPQSSSHSPHRQNCRWSLAISAKAVGSRGWNHTVKGLVKKYRGGGGGEVGRSRERVGHEVLSLVQGVGLAIFSYLTGWVSLFYYIDMH